MAHNLWQLYWHLTKYWLGIRHLIYQFVQLQKTTYVLCMPLQSKTMWKLTKEQVINAPRLAGDKNPRQAKTKEKKIKSDNNKYEYIITNLISLLSLIMHYSNCKIQKNSSSKPLTLIGVTKVSCAWLAWQFKRFPCIVQRHKNKATTNKTNIRAMFSN